MKKIKISKEYIKKWELDEEEVEILEAFENGELKSVDNLEEEKKIAKITAENTLKHLKKDKQITLRLNNIDLEKIREEAQKEGLPYQTLIGSILHKYAANISSKEAIL
ncbi:MAG: hypothetical protein LBF97_04395 [Elusimicrobiota bacterium]|jgi:predicted DNA binding CopG/RHH family protein|nr:hypothetical protein [Elusimicrobiota bacterium]